MKQNIINLVGIILILTLVGTDGYLRYQSDTRANKERVELQDKLTSELELSTTCEYKVDSLSIANKRLSAYETLTLAMVHRDEAKSDITYGVGDIVYLKSDSSRVIISDVLIGGGQYNYYVKYRVLFDDDTTKELIPELVY